MGMSCPNCGGTNTEPLPVVHSNGSQHFQSTHTAVSSDGQFIQGYSQGSQSSLLAQHCAPPAPPSPMPFIATYGIGGVVLYLSMTVCPLLARECVFVGAVALRHYWKQALVGLAIIAVGWLLMKGWYSQTKTYRVAKRRWQSSWFCYGCGRSHFRG